MDFSKRVALVTGAWRGLGRAAAVRLHERGASVAINVRDAERAGALAEALERARCPCPATSTGRECRRSWCARRWSASAGSISW